MPTTIDPFYRPPPRGEDLPYDDGEPMETWRHVEQMTLLIQSLRDAWRDRHDYFVAGNMFIYYSETQTNRYDFRGPDVFVVLDCDDHERKSWVVWEEDGRLPDVIIELTSDSTTAVDHGPKKDIYARLLRTAFYAIYDPWTGVLEAFELDGVHRRYVPIAPEADGRVRCEPLGLSLGVWRGTHARVEAPWLRWFAADGTMLPTGEERAAGAEERAAGAEERATSAEQRAAAAEAELAALRAKLEGR
jgi:Uma2 family endonuclease